MATVFPPLGPKPIAGLPIGAPPRSSSSGESVVVDANPPQYWEAVCAASSGTALGTSSLGVCTALPTDGIDPGNVATGWAWRANSEFRNNNTSLIALTTFIAGDVISFYWHDGRLWAAKNGVWQNSGAHILALGDASDLRPCASMTNNGGVDLSVTFSFETASWTYTPPNDAVALTGAVLLDENSITLSNGDLTADDGTVTPRGVVRADTAVTEFVSTLSDMT